MTRCCFVVLSGANCNGAPRGKLLKYLTYLLNVYTHNAEIEGSSPSLTTNENKDLTYRRKTRFPPSAICRFVPSIIWGEAAISLIAR